MVQCYVWVLLTRECYAEYEQATACDKEHQQGPTDLFEIVQIDRPISSLSAHVIDILVIGQLKVL